MFKCRRLIKGALFLFLIAMPSVAMAKAGVTIDLGQDGNMSGRQPLHGNSGRPSSAPSWMPGKDNFPAHPGQPR